MTPKVKAQMTRLSNYLIKELGAKVSKSKSTESRYYYLGTLTIRISDHTTRRNDGFLNIYVPFNDPNTFIVENNYTISVLKSLKEIKTFLHSLVFTQELCTEILNTEVAKELSESRKSINQLTLKNAELTEMINNRDEVISDLHARIRMSEKISLSNQNSSTKYMFAGNVVTINGISYPMNYFPDSFMNKVKNIITNDPRIKPL